MIKCHFKNNSKESNLEERCYDSKTFRERKNVLERAEKNKRLPYISVTIVGKQGSKV